LVDKRETVLDLPKMDEGTTLRQLTQGLNVPIAKPATDVDGSLGVPQGLIAISQHLACDDGLRPRQPTLLCTLRYISQQGDRALQPAAGHSYGSAARVLGGEKEGNERGASSVTFLDESVVGAFSQNNALLEMARPECSLREKCDVFWPEPTGTVGFPEQRTCPRPVSGSKCGPPIIEKLGPPNRGHSTHPSRQVQGI